MSVEEIDEWIETYVHDGEYWGDWAAHYICWSFGMWFLAGVVEIMKHCQ